MKNDLQQELNKLWAATILNYEIDILKNFISMNLCVLENSQKTFYKLTISNIATLYFLNDDPDYRHHFSDWEYLELTSIGILPKSIPISCGRKIFSDQNSSTVNMCLEVWNQVIYIEAGTICINDRLYEI